MLALVRRAGGGPRQFGGSAVHARAARGGKTARAGAARRRRAGLRGTRRFRPQEYYANSGCQPLAAPTAYTPELHAVALRILRVLYRPGHAYQRIGVLLLDLVAAGARQLTFWDFAATNRNARP